MSESYRNFAEFYPYYLSEHRNRTCRRLHFVGTGLALLLLLLAFMTSTWSLLLAVPLVGYSFAWVGHVVFERNRPATFRHPVYSLMGDLAMFRDILRGRIHF